MRRFNTRRFALTALAVCALCGCSRGGYAPAHVLRIAYAGDPASLVSLIAVDQEIIATATLFCQTLVGLSAANREVPILVTRVPSRQNGDVSRNGMRIVYHLRRGVRFADGIELTSADVAFTYRAIFDPRNRTTSIEPYRRILSLRTPDRYTVVVRLRAPWNAAVRVLFAQADYAFGIFPKHAFADTKIVGTRWEDAPFGTGPFRVKEWRRGDRILFEPNPYYRPRPKLSAIVMQIVPNLDSNFVTLRSGAADVGTLTPENVEQAAHLPGVRVMRVAENATDLLYTQFKAAPTNDVHVRRAIAYALDYRALANAWLHEYPSATSFLAPPIVTWKSVAVSPYRHDLPAAKRELDADGWLVRDGVRQRDGEPLTALIGADSENPISVRIATMVQSQVGAIGMRASIKTDPARIWFSPGGLLRNGKATLLSESWVGGSDPEQSLNLRCVQATPGDENHSFYCSPRFEALFDDQATTPSAKRRNRDFDAMQLLIHQDVPMIPLFYEYRLLGVARRVSGYRINMLFMPVDAERWDAN